MLVTFDFDSTLTKPVKKSFAWQNTSFWESSTKPREKVLDILRELSKQGHEIRVVTTRDRRNCEEVFGFINEHSLPVRDVHFTNGDDKRETLVELGADRHFDDSLRDLRLLEDTGVDARIVPHPHDKENKPEEVEKFDPAF